jgi:hypothetical protein
VVRTGEGRIRQKRRRSKKGRDIAGREMTGRREIAHPGRLAAEEKRLPNSKKLPQSKILLRTINLVLQRKIQLMMSKILNRANNLRNQPRVPPLLHLNHLKAYKGLLLAAQSKNWLKICLSLQKRQRNPLQNRQKRNQEGDEGGEGRKPQLLHLLKLLRKIKRAF